MEYVGKMLKKEFQGYGVFSGIVNSYDPSSGFFEIFYEDGDSEELEMSEVALLLEEKATVVEPGTEAELIEKKPRLGRKPKKRRRVETKTGIHSDSGNACGDNLSKDGIGHEGFSGTLEEKLANCPNDGLNSETLEHKVGNCSNDGLKLNHGLNLINGLNLNDAFNPNDGSNLDVNLFENVKKRDCIDLNLNVNDDFDENLKVIDLVGSGAETRKRECCFDLNLGFDDESKDTEGVCGEQLMDNTAVQMIEESQKEISGVAEEKLYMEDGSANGIVKGSCFENVDGNSVKGISGSNENVSEDTQLGSVKEIRKEEASVSSEELRGHASLGVMDANYAEDSRSLEVQLKEGLSEPSTTVNNECQDGSGSSYKRGTSGKKRRKLSGNLKAHYRTSVEKKYS
ncbi:hypothetical protein L1049_017883 [Liquidambar formosana]|uniref:PTM/DIR17-like Tudor domain-containing protein n=1 Tax=Liquidambar formosana TaxID=63359 RepID=A0AAP0R9L8_LIQFO